RVATGDTMPANGPRGICAIDNARSLWARPQVFQPPIYGSILSGFLAPSCQHMAVLVVEQPATFFRHFGAGKRWEREVIREELCGRGGSLRGRSRGAQEIIRGLSP